MYMCALDKLAMCQQLVQAVGKQWAAARIQGFSLAMRRTS